MSVLPWVIEDDYEIRINDVVDGEYTGEFIALGGEEYCGVRFDQVGSPDLRESTYEVSGGDGVRFGIERYGAVNWTITGVIHGTVIKNAPGDPDLTWDRWSKLARAWTNYPGRTTPRAVVPLYFKRPGREEMVVFGRPRRIDPETGQSHAGYIPYTALFMQSDPRYYAAVETSETVLLEPSFEGQLQMNDVSGGNIMLPFTTTSGTKSGGVVTNLGDTSTNPLIRIKGPVTNPSIILYDALGGVEWRAEVRASIPNGIWVDIDARHWMRSVTDQYGTSYAGYYRGVRLQDLVFRPGSHLFDYQGTDPTGTSMCQIIYRNAWSST